MRIPLAFAVCVSSAALVGCPVLLGLTDDFHDADAAISGTVLPPTNEGGIVGPVGTVTKITAGDNHTCVLFDDGRVGCWGDNSSGGLGDGTSSSRSRPVLVQGLSGKATAVAAGGAHTCAVLEGGKVQCWGDNDSGQLGDGTTGVALLPKNANDVTTAIAIATGGHHTCVIQSGGTLRCWGRKGSISVNDAGVPALNGVTVVAAGATSTCAAGDGGTWCWGQGFALGSSDSLPSTPVNVHSVAALDLSIGSTHACGVAGPSEDPKAAWAGGKVGNCACWGRNDVGQLAPGGGTDTNIHGPEVIDLPVPITRASAGGQFTCVITSEQKVQCFGRGDAGQLEGSAIESASAVVTGKSHACALLSDHSVSCWGVNSAGQLGDGTSEPRENPVRVTFSSP